MKKLKSENKDIDRALYLWFIEQIPKRGYQWTLFERKGPGACFIFGL